MEEEQLISLDLGYTQEEDQALISLEKEAGYRPVDPNVAAVRAFKFTYGFPNHTFNEYYNGLVSGKEDKLRLDAAAELDNIKSSNRLSLIRGVGDKLTPELLDLVDTSTGANLKTDPNTVFERQYGTEYLKYLDAKHVGWRNPKTDGFDYDETALADVKKYTPEVARALLESGSHAVAKTQVVLKGLEMAKTAAEGQSWLGWGADLAKPMFMPFYANWRLANLVPKDTPTAFRLSDDLLSTQQALWDLPTDAFERIFMGALNQLIEDNPSEAVRFASAMMSLGNSERRMMDIGQGFDVLTRPLMVDIAKGVFKGVTNKAITDAAARRLMEQAEALKAAELKPTIITTEVPRPVQAIAPEVGELPAPRPEAIQTTVPGVTQTAGDVVIDYFNKALDARDAVVDMVRRDVATPIQTRATIAENAGDVGTAAVHKVTDDVMAAVEGRLTPELQAIESLHVALRVDVPQVLREAPSAAPTQAVTDIRNRLNTARQVLQNATEKNNKGMITYWSKIVDELEKKLTGLGESTAGPVGPISTVPPAGSAKIMPEVPINVVETGKGTHSAYGGGRVLASGFATEAEARTAAEIWIGNNGLPRPGTKGKAYTPDTVPTFTAKPPEPPAQGAFALAPPPGGGAGGTIGGSGGGGTPPTTPPPPAAPPPAGPGVPGSGTPSNMHVNGSPALANKITQVIDGMGTRFVNLIGNIARVDRIPFEVATHVAVDDIKEASRKYFVGLDSHIVNTDLKYDPVTNVWRTENFFGKEGGEYFTTRNAALGAARYYGFKDAVAVEQVGAGWRYVVRKNIDETAPYIQSRINDTAFQTRPNQNSFIAFVAKYRTPEDILSLEHRAQRKIATYARNNLLQFYKDSSKYTREIANGIIRTDPITGERVSWIASRYRAIKDKNFGGSAQLYHDLDIAIKETPFNTDPVTGKLGYMFQYPHEIADFWRRHFRRDPEAVEYLAYLEQSRLAGIQHQLENLAVYRNLAREGNETYQITAQVGRNPATQKGFLKDSSELFEAKALKEIPRGKEGSLLIADSDLNAWEILNMHSIPQQRYITLAQKIANGELTLLEMANSDKSPFSKIGGSSFNVKRQAWESKRIQWVISKNVEMQALRTDLVPQTYKHFEHDVGHYIVQPNVQRETFSKKVFYDWYKGDMHIAGAVNSVIGRETAEKLDNVRKMYKDRKALPGAFEDLAPDVRDARAAAITSADANIKRYIENNLPWGYNTVHGWFNHTVRDGVTVPPALNLDHRIQTVPKNVRTVDLHSEVQDFYKRSIVDPETGLPVKGNSFRDGGKQGNPSKRYQIDFADQTVHDLTEVGTNGSWFNPLVTTKPVPYASPISSLNRSLAKMVDHTYLDDYKIYAMDSWLQRAMAGQYLKATPEEIRSAPLYHFFREETDWRSAYKAAASPKDVAAINMLEAEKYHIRNLLGIPSKVDNWFHTNASNFADAIYTKSPGVYNFLHSSKFLDPLWVLPAIPDAARAARSLVFHVTLGMFNPVQLLTQNMGWTNIYAIGGLKAATKAGVANILHAWLPHTNPAVRAGFDKMASKMGWRLGDFDEASKALNLYGFEKVGIEHVMRDANPTVITTRFGTFLDYGAIFFRSAERNIRRGAWFTAYSERRAAIGAAPMTKTDWKWILDRADLMAGNMSEASRSMMQRGIGSFSTQFLGYQLRLTELFMGKRLGTGSEGVLNKARLFWYNALAYGVPSAVGLTGLPLSDYIRTKATEYGYAVSDNFITNSILNGIPAATTQLITGWNLDIGRRYGPQSPLQNVVDALYGDKHWMEMVLGASATKFKDAIQSANGAMFAISNWDKAHPLKPEDIIDVAKGISSANNAWKYWMALNTGKLWSKNETFLDDKISTAEATTMFLTGLSTQPSGDVFLKQRAFETRMKIWEEAQKRARLEYRRGLQVGDDPINQETARKYISTAHAILKQADYPFELMPEFYATANKGYESMANQMDKIYNFKNLPTTDRKRYFDNWMARQKILNERTKY